MSKFKKITQIKIHKELVFIILAGFFIFFAFFYKYHLYHIEQMQLFMLTPEHFYSYFTKPAAISCYIGDFFTQFYYLKGGGPIVITLCLAVLFITANKLVKHFGNNKPLQVIPFLVVLLVAFLHTSIHYTLDSTIALLFSLLSILGYINLKNDKLRIGIGVFTALMLYFVVGAYLVVFAFGVLIFEVKTKKLKTIILTVYSCFIIAIVVALPLILRPCYYLTKVQAYIYPNNRYVSLVPDFELEKILSLDCEWYFNRPEKVIELAKKYELKNKFSSYYYNLALSASNMLPDGLMDLYQPASNALFIPADNKTNYMGIAFSNEAYYLIGDVNTSQHSSLLATTFSPKNQSSRMLRRLVEVNIINQEYAAAEKFIRMLNKTWFHGSWAKEMSEFLYNEQTCNKSRWITLKRAQIPTTDFIKEAPNDYFAVLNHLLKDHPGNKICLDYLLCAYLLNKDLDAFYKVIIEEIKAQRLNSLPKLYQEALLIYFAQNINDENKKLIDFSPFIFKSFLKYTDIYAANKGDGFVLQQDYGKTYWFYYHYATQKTQSK